MLGVDDFAFRKGHHYGTILVDLETHQPMALLADRKAETLVSWLEAHPGIELLSRDRSKTYRKAMTEGAPDTIQVACGRISSPRVDRDDAASGCLGLDRRHPPLATDNTADL